jgi:hypothetical protein
MPVTTKLAKRAIFHEIVGVPETWAVSTGGEKTRGSKKVRDGGAAVTETIAGQAEHANMVLTRPYDSRRDYDVEQQLRTLLTQPDSSVTVVRFMETRAGIRETTITGTIIGVSGPESDSMSSDEATITVTIAVDDMVN